MTKKLSPYEDQGITECPYCGSDCGFYVYKNIRYQQAIDFSGNPLFSEDVDPGSYTLETKRCLECHKVIRV